MSKYLSSVDKFSEECAKSYILFSYFISPFADENKPENKLTQIANFLKGSLKENEFADDELSPLKFEEKLKNKISELKFKLVGVTSIFNRGNILAFTVDSNNYEFEVYINFSNKESKNPFYIDREIFISNYDRISYKNVNKLKPYEAFVSVSSK